MIEREENGHYYCHNCLGECGLDFDENCDHCHSVPEWCVGYTNWQERAEKAEAALQEMPFIDLNFQPEKDLGDWLNWKRKYLALGIIKHPS